MMNDVKNILQNAKNAKPLLAQMHANKLNEMLRQMAADLLENQKDILAANKLDIENAKGKISDVMIDRLSLNKQRIAQMAHGILSVEALKSPVGMVENEFNHLNGMHISKVRVPVGVVAIIYESRPNVTSDAAALCIKSGNVCVLRGGSEAINTNSEIASVLCNAVKNTGGPAAAIQLLQNTSHQGAQQLMQARGYVDLLIPRGGAGLISAVVNGARGVPVIETGTGICHIYVDENAKLEMALKIVENAKVSRPSVCNSAEVCLVHRNVAKTFLPLLKNALEAKVQLRLDEAAGNIISGEAATQADFDTEFLDYILAVAVVNNVQEAIAHINAHSTGHSDAIVTQNTACANAFLKGVDSAAVYVNASTRFTDGAEFGLGCEMGISTQKIGARGPMGLYELTSYKYLINGTGQIR